MTVTLARRAAPSGPFRAGDRVQLTGPKGAHAHDHARAGGELHTHRGVLGHRDRSACRTAPSSPNSAGNEYLALRPLLSDFVMSMPRGAAIVYPKDAAQIVALADIFPGATVVEAGVGSGALSLWLLRAIGPTGACSRSSAARSSPRSPPPTSPPSSASCRTLERHRRRPRRGAAGESRRARVDRVVLDMLAPWECLDAVAEALAPGGVVLCYVATVTQLSRVAEALRGTGAFTEPEASETMVRGWHVEGLAVRPDHRMVAHTGFLITARRLAPGAVPPAVKRRASKTEYGDEDVELWTPGRPRRPRDHRQDLRKRVREAQRAAGGARLAAAAGDAAAGAVARGGSVRIDWSACVRLPLP